jgi:hypothetical protein
MQGLDEFLQSMMKSSGKDEPALAKSMEESGFAREMKDMFGQMTSQAMPSDTTLSEKARRVGEKWTGSKMLKMPGGQEMSLDSTYTLEGVDLVAGRRIARVSMIGKSRLKPAAVSPDAKPPAMPMPSVDSSGSEQGVFLFDLDRGRFVRWEMHHNRTGRFGDVVVGGLTISGGEIRSKSTSLTELVGPEDLIDPQSVGTLGK